MSSAYTANLTLGELGMSLVCRIKSSDPRSEPCGTPAQIGLSVERSENCLTQKVLPERYDRIKEIMCGGMPSRPILYRSPSCHTESNACAKSRKTAPVECRDSSAPRISSVSRRSWKSADKPSRTQTAHLAESGPRR